MVDVAAQREYLFRRVFNFRDLGGHVTADGRRVRWRRLFRSDTLSGLDEEEREEFGALGIRTVIDLRRAYEVEEQGRCPEWPGLDYRHIDPDHPEWTETPYLDGLDPVRYLADRYRDLAETGAPRLAEAIGVIADAQAAPVVVHCVAGKDRTGVLCALALSLLGVPDADIDSDYTLTNTGQQRWLAWARANGQPERVMQPWYRSPAGTMTLFLEELRERHGSVEGYAVAAGLEPDQLSALRGHLLD